MISTFEPLGADKNLYYVLHWFVKRETTRKDFLMAVSLSGGGGLRAGLKKLKFYFFNLWLCY